MFLIRIARHAASDTLSSYIHSSHWVSPLHASPPPADDSDTDEPWSPQNDPEVWSEEARIRIAADVEELKDMYFASGELWL